MSHVKVNINRSKRLPLWPHAFMALFGAGWGISFEAGARIYSAEVVAVVGLALVGWRTALRQFPMARPLLGAYALWVLAILIADGVNETALLDSARNLATPIIGACSMLFAISFLSRNPASLLSFLAGVAISKGFLGEPLYGDTFADQSFGLAAIDQNTDYFKVRIDPFLTPAVLLVACWFGRRRLLYSATVLLAASIGYLVVDDRSTGLVLFFSALALIAKHFRFRPSPVQFVAFGMLAFVVSYSGYVSYVDYTLAHNPEGHNGQQLARMDNPYNPIELLVTGRSEWLVMTTAIAERPVFGWGSWAIDTGHRFAYLRSYRSGEIDYGYIERKSDWGYIPVHSVIGSTWVWSGFLGFVAMLWLFRSMLLMAIRLANVESILVPALLFLTLQIIWHFFFSPPQHVRLSFPVALASLVVLTRGPLSVRPHAASTMPPWLMGVAWKTPKR